MKAKKLNLDIADRITEFESLMRKFLVKRILYKLIFRGKGLEFEGYREYSPDDDAQDIDWKASMRSGETLVKKYIEERDLNVVFVVDISENMVFGSTKKLKCEYAAELSAALSHLIINSGDKIGFVLFDDNIKKMVSPKGGLKQFYLFVDNLSNPSNYGGNSNLKSTISYLSNYLSRSTSVVIIISDFIRMNKNIKEDLTLFAKNFETMALIVNDPLDKTLPNLNREMVVEDPVSGEQLIINPHIAKKEYERKAREHSEMIKRVFEDSGVDYLNLMTDKPFVVDLAQFMAARADKKKYIMSKS